MDFSVKIESTEKSVPLTMESSETIAKIKEQIQDKEGISKDHQELIFRGNRLENNLTLKECNVQKGCTLNLVSPKVEITVKMQNDKTITLEIDQSDVVINIKKKIAEQLKMEIDPQLILTTQDGTMLENGRSISRYNLQIGSILHLNPKKESMKVDPDQPMVLADKSPEKKVPKMENKPLAEEDYSSDDDVPVYGSRRSFSNLTLQNTNTGSKIHGYTNTQPTIQGRSTVVPDVPQKKMQIFVKTMTGKNIVLEVESQHKIERIREMIADKEGLSANEQTLIFCGKELENGRTLTYYNVKDGDTLQLVMRMRGGM